MRAILAGNTDLTNMLWNQRFLYLHIPKTAGKSLTRYFVEAWQKPVYGVVSGGQLSELADCDQKGLHLRLGRGHEDLKATRELLREQHRDVDGFEAVFVCIRNPYDLMVSNYHFLRQSYPKNKSRINFQLAATTSFEEFCTRIGKIGPQDWMTIDGTPLRNLCIIRFERLLDDLAAYARRFGFENCQVPHLNPSKRGHYRDYLTPIAEEYIFRKFRYWFESGYYEREAAPAAGAAVTGRTERA